jgi:hypothetical protein
MGQAAGALAGVEPGELAVTKLGLVLGVELVLGSRRMTPERGVLTQVQYPGRH